MTRANGKRRRVMSEQTDLVNDDSSDSASQSDSEQVDFFNIFDGTKGRSNGRYLDMDERKEAETTRAAQEDREPDYSDPGSLPAGVGTPFVSEARRVDNSHYSNPSILVEGPKDVDPVVNLEVNTGQNAGDVDLSQAAQIARERVSNDQDVLAAVDQGGEPQNSGEVETGPAPDPAPEFTQTNPDGSSQDPLY